MPCRTYSAIMTIVLSCTRPLYATAFAIGGRSASLARLSARQHSPQATAWAGRAQRGMPMSSEATGSSDVPPAPSGEKWDGKELGTTSEVKQLCSLPISAAR